MSDEFAGPIRKRNAVLLVILGIALLISLFVPSLNQPRIHTNTGKCAANLKSLLQAMMLYANEHGGAYPDSLGRLILTEDITSEVLICPATYDERATGATTKEVAFRVHEEPGYLSYVYPGKSFKADSIAPDRVLIYEPLSNHHDAGMNVGFGSGKVAFIEGERAVTFLNELEAGHNPPRAEMLK